MKKPIKVAVTGPAGQIGYALLFRIASGAMFGPDQLSDYVGEVPAGSAQKWGLKVGDPAQLVK